MIHRPIRHPKSSYNRRGLTAIELVVASALAVMLMASVLGVLTRLATQRKLIEQKTTTETWQFQLAGMIRHDLESAERVSVRRDELSMIGYGGQDFESGAATLRPTQIRYAIVADRGTSWLMREETHLDEATNVNWRRELACRDAASFEVSAYNMKLQRWEDVLVSPREQTAVSLPAPAWLRVRIYGTGQDTLLIDEIVTRHGVVIE